MANGSSIGRVSFIDRLAAVGRAFPALLCGPKRHFPWAEINVDIARCADVQTERRPQAMELEVRDVMPRLDIGSPLEDVRIFGRDVLEKHFRFFEKYDEPWLDQRFGMWI